MEPLVFTEKLDLAILTAAKAGWLTGAKADVWQDDLTPTRTTDDTAFTAPTFGGYAQKTITWHDPSIADDGTPELVGNAITWRPTDASGGDQNVNVITIKDTTGADTYLMGRVCPPGENVPMNNALQELVVVPRVRIKDGKLVLVT